MSSSTGWWQRAALIAAALAAAATGGCTSPVPGHGAAGPPPPTTARGATYLAMLSLSTASAVHYRGSFDNGGDVTGLDATVTSAGEASGTLTVDRQKIGLLVLQGATYLRAPEVFWTGGHKRTGITKRYGNNWVRVPPKVFGLDVGAVLAPGALARSQHPVIPAVPDGHVADLPTGTVNGARTVKVDAQGTVYELTADQPYRLLRLSTPAVPRFAPVPRSGPVPGAVPRAVPPRPGTPVPDAPDATDLQVDLTDASADLARVYAGLARRAAQLGGAIDGAGKVKLGAQDFVGCGAAGCTIAVDFTNEGASATRVGLHADWEGGDKPIGGCDGTSGPVAAHHGSTVTCTIASAGWASFYERAISSSGGLPYGASYSVLPLAAPPDAARLAADVTAARCGTSGAARPAGCPAAGAAPGGAAPGGAAPGSAAPGGVEVRDAAVRAGYAALKRRFGQGVPYGGVGGLRLAGAAPARVHPDDGYPDLVVFFGDQVFVYQVADAATAERARRQLGGHLSGLRDALFDRSVRAETGPPIGTITLRDPHLGSGVTLSSRTGYPGVIFYSIG